MISVIIDYEAILMPASGVKMKKDPELLKLHGITTNFEVESKVIGGIACYNYICLNCGFKISTTMRSAIDFNHEIMFHHQNCKKN